MKAFLISLFCMIVASACPVSVSANGSMHVEHITIVGLNSHKAGIDVEMAVTQEEQVHGLMDRTKMADNAGMLFLFDSAAEVSFWMKDTLIPLDMMFVDVHGRIFNIHENAKPNDLTSIPSGGPAKAVIELNGGAAARQGIKVGDTVYYKAFH